MLTRTPSAVTDEINALVQRVVPLGEAQFLDITPRSDGVINECFAAVEAQVERHGGRVQHGWSIWEWPGVMIEAEFHAVWEKPDGSLLCVTPRPDSERRILFVPDPTRVWEGRYVDNVRVALRKDARITEYIRLAEKKGEVLNRGERATKFGPIAVPIHEIEPIMTRMGLLQQELSDPQWQGPSRNQPCPCGSGKVFKRCHGKRLA